MAALAPVAADGCAPGPEPDLWTCALPAGALDPGPDPSTRPCFVQTDPGTVRFADENGVKGDMTGPMCLTWNSLGPSDVATKPGHVHVAGGQAHVRPWGERTPQAAGLWAPLGCGASSSYGALDLSGDNVRVRDLSLASGCYGALNLRGADLVVRDVAVYTGSVTLTASSRRARLEAVSVRNAYRRPVNMGATTGGEAWSTNSAALVVQGVDFLLRDVETFGAREGASFSGGAHGGLVDGATFHGHHNHGFKVIDPNTHDLTLRDVLAYNSQETLFIECPHDITFQHVTLPGGHVIVQGNPGGCTPARLTFTGSVLCGVTWFAYGGDTWAEPGGHVLDRNVYVTGHPACDGDIRHVSSDSTFDLGAWQTWAGDPCTDCVRDPNSVHDDVADAFVNFVHEDDTAGAAPDFHLPAEAAAIDLDVATGADGRDRDGAPRDEAPDAGCYELGQP